MIGVFETDPAARLVVADAVMTRLTGGTTLGRTPWSAASATSRTEIERAWSTRTTEEFDTEFDIGIEDQVRRARVVMSPRLGADGTLLGYLGTVVVDDRDDPFHRVARRTDDIVWSVDDNGTVTFFNEATRRLVGEASVPNLASTLRDQLPRALLAGAIETWRGEIVVRDTTGDTRTLDCSVVTAPDGGFTVWSRDVTSSARLHTELAHQATHDALTGLPSRPLFLRRVAAAVERSRVDGHSLAVLYVDIDHLKVVNDTLGHDDGDDFISLIGRRLVASTRPDDVIGRMGGDEFVILCERVGDETTALDLAERIISASAEPVVLRGRRIATGVSIGVAIWKPSDRSSTPDGSPPDIALELVRRADTAMYRAKARGKGRCESFTDAMSHEVERRGRLRLDLERALADQQLHLVFQPIAALHTGRVEAAEALLRWDHPTEGLLTPADFVDLADETGLVVPIGDWVVDEALRVLGSWIADGRADRHFRMHVNVSTHQVVDTGFVESLTAAVRRHGLTPANLSIEYHSGVLDDDEAARTLRSLHRLGFVLTIDDFGDRRSSLADLRTSSPHYVKLAGSFVRPLDVDDRDDPMVRGLVQLAHGLDVSVIASWVVSNHQLQRLRALGCDHVQGFHVARPVRADDFDPTAIVPRVRD
ncbi:MAG: EAL domain-containing protein [Actinomycetota bacterium]|nr:EAL domain-containing protein [Actinomycetota bacterium]MDA2971694.1 EAL domain-containing protein [Actinomycetota bacterium]MDA3001462.1 EAL domain-containing protein [Actinomycetota bacterium]